MLPSSLSSKSFMYGLYHPYLYFLVAIFQSLFSCRYYLKSSFFRFYHLNLYLLASIILISIFSVLSAKSIPSCFYHLNLYLVFFFFPCVLICLSGSLLHGPPAPPSAWPFHASPGPAAWPISPARMHVLTMCDRS